MRARPRRSPPSETKASGLPMALALPPEGIAFFRHPQAKGAAGRCIGRTDLPVDPRRARRLAHRIRALARRARLPRIVFTSPLRRCADVGRWLRSWGFEHRIDALLLEADFGNWDGRPWSAIGAEAVDAWCADFAAHAPGGGESLGTLAQRVAAWNPDGARLVVGHAGWITLRRWQAEHGEHLPSATEWPATLACATAWVETTRA